MKFLPFAMLIFNIELIPGAEQSPRLLIAWLSDRVERLKIIAIIYDKRNYRASFPSANLESSGKANVVAEAFRVGNQYDSWRQGKEEISLSERWTIDLCVRGQNGFWASLRVEPNLISQIKAAQKDDGEIWAIIQNLDKQTEFHVDSDGILWQGTKLCEPRISCTSRGF
ncbi:hypothetical protein Tco_1153868 [Tanacetum coccineum]